MPDSTSPVLAFKVPAGWPVGTVDVFIAIKADDNSRPGFVALVVTSKVFRGTVYIPAADATAFGYALEGAGTVA